MSVSEHDLETLESWLDGELPEAQAELMRLRFSSEPQLSQTLDRLRSDRELRTRIWQTMEPAEKELESLVVNVRRSVRREDLVASRLRIFRNAGAIAASLALVFMAGWMTRSRVKVNSNEVAFNIPSAPAHSPNSMLSRPVVTLVAPQAMPGNIVNTGSINPADSGKMLALQPNPRVRVAANREPLSTLLPRYRVQVISPMGMVFNRELEKLSDLVDLPQEIETQEARLNQQSPLLPQIPPQQSQLAPQMSPRQGGSSNSFIPVNVDEQR